MLGTWISIWWNKKINKVHLWLLNKMFAFCYCVKMYENLSSNSNQNPHIHIFSFSCSMEFYCEICNKTRARKNANKRKYNEQHLSCFLCASDKWNHEIPISTRLSFAMRRFSFDSHKVYYELCVFERIVCLYMW